jgi:hypothetical protein
MNETDLKYMYIGRMGKSDCKRQIWRIYADVRGFWSEVLEKAGVVDAGKVAEKLRE